MAHRRSLPIALPSSKSLIDGIPAPLLFTGNLVLNMRRYLEDIMNTVLEEEYKESIRNLSNKAPEYKQMASDFNIQYDSAKQDIVYSVKGNSADVAKKLEYGPPAKSLLRGECERGASRMSRKINKELDYMTGIRSTR